MEEGKGNQGDTKTSSGEVNNRLKEERPERETVKEEKSYNAYFMFFKNVIVNVIISNMITSFFFRFDLILVALFRVAITLYNLWNNFPNCLAVMGVLTILLVINYVCKKLSKIISPRRNIQIFLKDSTRLNQR